MLFVRLTNNHADYMPKIVGAIDIKEITQEMYDNDLNEEIEEILHDKASELCSGTDPLPYFIRVDEAISLRDALTDRINKIKELSAHKS